MKDLQALSAAALCVACLAGCAATDVLGERITQVDVLSAYSPNTFGAFAASGPLVELQGPIPGGASPQEVAAALRMPGFWPDAPFTAVAQGEAPEMQRIVIGFGAATAANAMLVCDGRPASGGVADSLQANVVYCMGRRAASSAHLSRSDLATPADPAFGDAFARVFLQIAPRRDPERDDDCRIRLCL
ncbi:hypothetical protein SAMN05444370_11096 [Rubrimonas cliftonensis]|uniref:Pilus assembly protein CpaD n=2 Tax=Rubrimonas cliftonensis TaxID=89524 RepID=A0A1H4DKJ3_9RHOB|nr:hypothetical protein SAMN05444370_11096 [Rubrimonas cliftonensis]